MEFVSLRGGREPESNGGSRARLVQKKPKIAPETEFRMFSTPPLLPKVIYWSVRPSDPIAQVAAQSTIGE